MRSASENQESEDYENLDYHFLQELSPVNLLVAEVDRLIQSSFPSPDTLDADSCDNNYTAIGEANLQNCDEVETEQFLEDLVQPISIPFVGMEFDTLEASLIFWNKYANDTGFGGRINGTNKRKSDGVIRYRMYVCSREGVKVEDPRRVLSKRRSDTRCRCGVRMIISLNDKEKYCVTSFVAQHNHPLEGKGSTHLLRAHQSINPIQARAISIGVGAGLGPKTMHRYMSIEAEGFENVGFTREDVKSHLRTKRAQYLELGEATTILEYFQEQSKISQLFFYDFQLDCEGQITNIFWADAKMVLDYECFGDVVMFDTTFGTNKESRPLGIFTGFNNHRQTVVFGGTLLFDETAASFGWLFNTFMRCHGEKSPEIIFTDQDAAMKSALEVVMPTVRHGLCTWHILQNATKNLSGVLGGKKKNFISELAKCMYEYSNIDEFEQKWKHMVEYFGLVGNKWLETLYEKKSQCCIAYMKDAFTAGTRSTQLSESVNARVKQHLGSGLKMKKFFDGFEMFLMDVREKELVSDCKCRQSTPHVAAPSSSILSHVAEIYTPNVFKLFNDQFFRMFSVALDKNDPIVGPHLRIAKEGGKAYNINFDSSSLSITCSCCLYEMCGYFCSHILRLLDVLHIEKISDNYILKRWTMHAKSGLSNVMSSPSTKFTKSQRLDILCSEWLRVAYRAFEDVEVFERIRSLISDAHSIIDKCEKKTASGDSNNSNAPLSFEPAHVGVTGLKKKSNPKAVGKRRIKSCLERGRGRKTSQTSKQTLLQVNESQGDYGNEDDIHLTL